MRHAEFVLRVISASVRWVETQELRVLVDGEDERLGRVLAQIRVAQTELRVRPNLTLRVRLDDLLEELTGGDPFLFVEGRHPTVVQESVGLRGAGRHGVARLRGARGGGAERQDESGESYAAMKYMHRNHRVPANHVCSAASPSSRPTLGSNPRSARASDVSA